MTNFEYMYQKMNVKTNSPPYISDKTLMTENNDEHTEYE